MVRAAIDSTPSLPAPPSAADQPGLGPVVRRARRAISSTIGARPASVSRSQPRQPRPLRARPVVTGWQPPPWLTASSGSGGSSAGCRPGADGTESWARWCRRPVLSAAVRALIVTGSVGAAMVTAIVASRVLPRPAGGAVATAWWLGIVAVTTLVLLGANLVGRRLLPLAALLNLSLAFPGSAPDRFRLAFRSGTARDLERRLAQARDRGLSDEPARAAADILALVGAMTAHDRRTRGHSERVRAFNDLIAEEMNLPTPDRERLRWAALLHDVGKLHTPTRVLNKPGPLTDEEWQALHRHPEDGARMAAPLRGWLGPWAHAIEQHHERWDGSGYPKGLAGSQISLGARIVAVADAYEVMTSPRPYQRAKSARAAREEMACATAGSQFDPVVVRAFLAASVGKLRKVVGPISWLVGLPYVVSGSQAAAAVAAAGRHALVTAGAAGAVGALSVAGLVPAHPDQPVPPAPTRPAPQAGAPDPSSRPPAGAPAVGSPSQEAPAATPQAQAPPVGPPAGPGVGRPSRGKTVVRIDPSALGVGGGVPPIEITVPDPALPVDVPLPPLPGPLSP